MVIQLCSKEKCTLCMACINICPKNAISIKKDTRGFEYLDIENNKCIKCGQCMSVCNSRKNIKRHEPIKSYALQLRDKKDITKSASGGAVQIIAKSILKNGGVVYGCALQKDQDGFFAEHIRIEKEENLEKILNSKYLPSYINRNYKFVESDLKQKKQVLFIGVPCQIQGLKAYLKRDYENLLTIDVICHGVPNKYIFNEYIKSIEKLDNICITNYIFRDKDICWGTNSSYLYYKMGDKKKKTRTFHQPRELSSFMTRYLCRDIFRDNCYSCELSNIKRVSDITCGDFWSIEVEHPEYITTKKNRMSIKRGISCVLINTEKGNSFLKGITSDVILHETNLDSIVKHNDNLKSASKIGARREMFFKDLSENGYMEIEKKHRKSISKKRKLFIIKNNIKSRLPDKLRIKIYTFYAKKLGKLDY